VKNRWNNNRIKADRKTKRNVPTRKKKKPTTRKKKNKSSFEEK
jgi:hypothetical protein